MKRFIWLVALAACGGDPVDAEGTYTISVTNRENGCNFPNWTVGNSATNISVVINQEGEDVNADVMGLTRVYLDAVLGSHVFHGTVDGSELDLSIDGTTEYQNAECTGTIDARLTAELDGDVLTGRIDYTVDGAGDPECAPFSGCITYQDMNGTRPPQ